MNKWMEAGIDAAKEYGPKIAIALVTLVVGLIVIKMMATAADRMMKRSGMDDTLRPFLTSLLSWVLKAALVVALLTTVGIEATSFVALLGAAGLAVGMALQGSLGHFAGGVLIMVFRPYAVGDLVEVGGVLGVVKEIQIFATVLLTPENKTVYMPNGKAAADAIVNYAREGNLRVDMNIGIAYDADIKKAREVLMKVITDHPHVLKEPAPSINVSELGDNAVNLVVRPYAEPAHYWDVYFGVYEAGKEALDAAGIGIPFPQRDVHLYKAD